MAKDVLIIGGGITALKAALTLDEFGIGTVIVEKEAEPGGKVKGYSAVFPTFSDGRRMVQGMVEEAGSADRILLHTRTQVSGMVRENGRFRLTLTDGQVLEVGAVIVANGFDPFDPARQPQYGYGVYPNVVTSVELEALLDPEGPTGGRLLKPSDGRPARSVAIIFCVGSRNKKLGNPYCSRICCSYSTKQAIEIKRKDSETAVTCFYMDIRTYGKGFEEMYQHAQELGVKYVRGRVSECSMDLEGNIQIRAENTLLGKPVQGLFDLVSLSVGMTPCRDAEHLAGVLGLSRDKHGFLALKDEETSPHESTRQGVFLAGAVTGLKPIRDCLLEGVSVGARVAAYLKKEGGRHE